MHPTARAILILIVAGLLAGHGATRNADGTLGLIKLPNNGNPVITTGNTHFMAVLEKEATLVLSSATGWTTLETTWSPLPGGLVQGDCKTTAPLAPGTYALQAQTEAGTDVNNRSVYSIEAFPETYQVAHVTDIHLGKFPETQADRRAFQNIIETINTSEAAFTLITGDSTDNGTPEQFQAFLEQLDRCRTPTFVVPGNHDRAARNYQQFFGPATYTFSFGKDGYLAFDTKDFLIADEMSPQNGLLYSYRRQIRASRWSIGFTHRYDPAMGMRAQLCLFVDDPLDYLVYGHYHREPGNEDGIPWGATRHILTPAAVDGKMRFLHVDATGVTALETIAPAQTATADQ